MRAKIETGHAHRSEIEVELTRRQSELQFLDETSQKELNVPVAELEVPEDTSPEVLQAAEAAYKETRTKIENLGAVNPSAWEEFQEAQQRHDFLTAQRQDLLDSIRDTEEGHSGDRRIFEEPIFRSFQGDQRKLQAGLSDVVRRRFGRNASHR